MDINLIKIYFTSILLRGLRLSWQTRLNEFEALQRALFKLGSPYPQ